MIEASFLSSAQARWSRLIAASVSSTSVTRASRNAALARLGQCLSHQRHIAEIRLQNFLYFGSAEQDFADSDPSAIYREELFSVLSEEIRGPFLGNLNRARLLTEGGRSRKTARTVFDLNHFIPATRAP